MYMTKIIRTLIWGYARLAPSLLNTWYVLYSSIPQHPEPAQPTGIISKHTASKSAEST